MKEIWKEVVGFEGLYEVSSSGNVRTIPHNTKTKNGKIYPVRQTFLKPGVDIGGYKFVILRKNKRSFNLKIHRLVAEAFCLKEDPSLNVVNHIDENILNNCYNNLEWCTNKYNLNYKHRRTKEVESKGVKIAQYDKVGNLISIYPSIGEASRQTGIDRSLIAAVSRHESQFNNWGYKRTSKGFVWVRGKETDAKWDNSEKQKEFIKKEYDENNKIFVDRRIFNDGERAGRPNRRPKNK